MPTRRRSISALLLLTGFVASACTAILVPDEDDDGVVRCNNSEDCEGLIDDNRYISQCVFGEGQPESSSKICAPELRENIGCGGAIYPVGHPLTDAYDDAVAAKAAYGACTMENRGKRGCPPLDGVCNDGLSINNATGVCDDPDDPIPAIHPPGAGGVDIAGQDVKDQFCRWYFCDESYVCVSRSGGELCQPCSASGEYGEGGCGELYIQGEPSPVYTDLSSCNMGSSDPDQAVIGPAPMVP